MMQLLFLATTLALSLSFNANGAGCSPRPGYPHGWEGGGDGWNACTGNYLITAPYLFRNSQGDLTTDVGFGAGWKAAYSHFTYISGVLRKISVSGNSIEYQPTAQTNYFVPVNGRTTANFVVAADASTLYEYTPGFSYSVYKKLSGDSSGKFLFSGTRTLKNANLQTVSWHNSERPKDIYDHRLNKVLRFSYSTAAQPHLVSVVGFMGNSSVEYYYSANGELERIQHKEAGNPITELTYGYDNNQVVCSSEPVVVVPGLSNQLPDCTNSSAVEGRYSMSYDSSGRLLSLSQPDSFMKTITYPGSFTRIVDSLQDSVEYHYTSGKLTSVVDEMGRVSTITRSSNSTSSMDTVVHHTGESQTFHFDVRGNLTKAVDPLGIENNFTYDGYNRLLAATADANTVASFTNNYSYQYSAASPTVTVSNAAQETSVITLNNYGQSVSEVSTTVDVDGATLQEQRTFNYSNAGGWLSSYLTNTSHTNALGLVTNTSIAYGTSHAVSSVSTEGLSGSFNGNFDGLGRLTSLSGTALTDAGLSSASFGYDSLGQMTSATVDGNSSANVISYSRTNTGATLNSYIDAWEFNGNGQSVSVVVDPFTQQVKHLSETINGTVKTQISDFVEAN